LLDENFVFWYCDHDYLKTLEKFGVKNSLISSSFVTHLGSESLKTLDENEHNRLTQIPRFYFSYKWHHHSYIRLKLETILFKLKMLLRKS